MRKNGGGRGSGISVLMAWHDDDDDDDAPSVAIGKTLKAIEHRRTFYLPVCEKKQMDSWYYQMY